MRVFTFGELNRLRREAKRLKKEKSISHCRALDEIAAAQGTAEANRLLTQSLTPEVLTNKYLEAIKNGTTFVVPEGSTPFVQIQK